MVQATVVGASGYLGRELLRTLLQHPRVDAVATTSTRLAGTPWRQALPALGAEGTFCAPDSAEALDADIVFLATPGGAAAAAAQAHADAGASTIIDLSRDHRLQAIEGSTWQYGLADVWPVARGASRIANPGCYPTAALLALAPALQAGALTGNLIVDGKSGVSGAGVNPAPHLHFPEMNEAVSAYKVLGHDHTAEIRGAASKLANTPQKVRFTPHLVPQTRGLLVTAYADCAASADMQKIYADAYEDSVFVRHVTEANTGHVRGSNRAHVAVDVDPDTGLLVARCAIDNMQKGGAGTAVQNMNTAMGWDTGLGLNLHGAAP